MSRKNKIIVSVVGVVIITLALLGITYGYFLTRIEGNTNPNSISITTANLRLVYGDGTTQILTQNNIIPGTTVSTKDFTVTNEGNQSSDYEVYLENVINTFTVNGQKDVKLTITCTSELEDGSVGTCSGYNSTYPSTNSKLISNTIDVGEVHSYELVVKYEETNTDQSEDMGKTLQGKIQIYDPKDVVAISGTVTGYDSSYYVELHSDVKTSQIASDGSYIFYGVGVEDHTLYVKKKNSDGTISDVGNKTISVTKGENASITSNASNIIINDDSSSVMVNISVSDNKDSITLNGTKLYSKTLSDQILVDNTTQSDSSIIVNSGNYIYSTSKTNTVNVTMDMFRTVANSFTYDSSKNTYKLTGTFVYLDNTGYVYELSDKTKFACKGTSRTCTTLYMIDEVVDDNTVKAYEFTNGELPELVDNGNGLYYTSDLTKTENGKVSYYFRGDVSNNYVKFGKYNSDVVRYKGEIEYYGPDVYNTLAECESEATNCTEVIYANANDDMLWRIVRINEDGSVRLVMEDIIQESIFSYHLTGDGVNQSDIGYMYGSGYSLTDTACMNPTTKAISTTTSQSDCLSKGHIWLNSKYEQAHSNRYNSTVKGVIDKWYQENFIVYTDYLADAGFCNDRSIAPSAGLWDEEDGALGYDSYNITFYGPFNRLENLIVAQFKCPNEKQDLFTLSGSNKGNKSLTYPIGLLTTDEIKFAGGVAFKTNYANYLSGNSTWTMSARTGCAIEFWRYILDSNGMIDYTSTDEPLTGIRPVINLRADVELSNDLLEGCTKQDGTESCPYIIDISE